MDRVLVTGGAGFIGSHLVEATLDQGLRVRVFDNLSSGSLENLSSHSGDQRLEFVKGDVIHARAVSEAIQGMDSVVHLAALVSVPASIESPRKTLMVNSMGTLNVLNACVEKRVRRVVYASTCAVYGDPKSLPVSEDHPLNPLSPYAASKLAGEAYCGAFSSTHGLDTVCLRFFNVYGRRQSSGPYAGVIVEFLDMIRNSQPPTIYGDGNQTRDFIHVSDVVEAILRCLGHEGLAGEKVNIGTGKGTTINSLAHLVLRIAGKQMVPVHEARREGEIRHSVADTRKAESLLGFRPAVSLEQGLSDLVLATPDE